MAIMPYFLGTMISLIEKFGMSGRLVTYGRQEAFFTEDFLKRSADSNGFTLKEMPATEKEEIEGTHPLNPNFISTDPRLQVRLNDQLLFRMLGFDEIMSIDASPYEGATRVFDMNAPEFPDDIAGWADVAFDIGTMEHVFHVPNFLSNLTDSVRTGGLVFQVLPMNNWANHGFYQFSPTLLEDYYSEAGFTILDRMTFRIYESHWSIADHMEVRHYPDGASFVVPKNRLDNHFYFTGVVVRKEAGTKRATIPTQAAYKAFWSK